MMTDPPQELSPPLDERNWAQERKFREQEIDISWADQRIRKRELGLKVQEFQKSKWRSPLVVAVLAAAVAAGGNAVVAFLNGSYQRSLEQTRAERDEAQRKEQFD